MKPGYKTTEFWLTLAANLLAALIASGALSAEGDAMKVAAFLAAMLANVGYVAGRSYLKRQ